MLAQPFLADSRARDRLLRRMFLIILKDYFFGNNSFTIYFSIVGALKEVDRIGDYDWAPSLLPIFSKECVCVLRARQRLG